MKPGSERMIWPCAHIQKNGDRYETINYALGDFETKIRVDCTHWVACPICLAKRPEEPVGLGEKLYEYMSYPSSESIRSKADSLAHKARQHYFSVENQKSLAKHLDDLNTWGGPSYLAEHVCEWFRGIK